MTTKQHLPQGPGKHDNTENTHENRSGKESHDHPGSGHYNDKYERHFDKCFWNAHHYGKSKSCPEEGNNHDNNRRIIAAATTTIIVALS